MVDLWFVLVCAMFAAYVVLDGYDLGAGIVAPFVARTDAERRSVLHSILPFWDGNEVYLVAGGATLYLAFPRLFPLFMSGFYLPAMILLWLLMGRGLGIEMRHKLGHPLWNQLWDGVFFVSSTLLVIVYGAALGNVVRGVSVDEHGSFFAPLWTNFGVGDDVGVLDWYTLLVAATATAMIARHGALRLAARADDAAVRARSANVAAALFAPTVLFVVATSAATFRVQPNVLSHLASAGPLAAIAAVALIASFVLARAGRQDLAFTASALALAALFGCASASIHPYGLVARTAGRSILLADGAASPYALRIGLFWWIPGMSAVVAYSRFAHRRASIGT